MSACNDSVYLAVGEWPNGAVFAIVGNVGGSVGISISQLMRGI